MSAVLSDCGLYRYSLTRSLPQGELFISTAGRILWVMLNPSTADATQDDATIRRCVGFSQAWGYSELEVVNLFGFRATHPVDLTKALDPVGPDNDAAIDAASERAIAAVVAWGDLFKLDRLWEDGVGPLATGGMAVPRARAVEARLMRRHELLCLGHTKTWHPRHPLRVPGRRELERYCRR